METTLHIETAHGAKLTITVEHPDPDVVHDLVEALWGLLPFIAANGLEFRRASADEFTRHLAPRWAEVALCGVPASTKIREAWTEDQVCAKCSSLRAHWIKFQLIPETRGTGEGQKCSA